MSDVAIQVRNLSKQYRIGVLRHDTLRDCLSYGIRRFIGGNRHEARPHPDIIWALKDVSFDVEEGEVVGIIGRNGSGKSTLLKILSRITEPTTGYVKTKSRIGSLLEVGTGFHPELTGRENIYLNGAILGMKKGEIERKFDEIVAFSEIERFLDTPVKRYSSGMYVRLAFSIAAHMESEIILIDEVLTVGDTKFQSKCSEKLMSVAKTGRTVLIVSHNMNVIHNLCTKGVVLQEGRQVFMGEKSQAISFYLDSLDSTTGRDFAASEDRKGMGRFRIKRMDIVDGSGNRNVPIRVGSRILLIFKYQGDRPVRNPRVIVSLHDHTRVKIARFDSHIAGDLPDVLPESGELVCSTDELSLAPGRYYLNVACYCDDELQDYLHEAAHFDVTGSDYFGTGRTFDASLSKIFVRHRWDARDDSY